MLNVTVTDNAIHFGESVQIRFYRTLRIPDDGRTYPLPPGLGCFPVFRVDDYASRVPPAWREHGGVFIPMYQREAMWISFAGLYWKPNAVMVGVGKVNSLTGRRWHDKLTRRPQNYLVVPDQPWLDGINAGKGYIRQFVAMPLGMGYTVEGQITGKERFGGLQLMVFEPKPGRFPDKPRMDRICWCSAPPDTGGQMGLAAGGRMRQKIYPDRYGLDTWDTANFGRVYVHILNSMMFREITGMEPPPTPVSARQYTEAGLPWFDLYDEDKGDIPPSKVLQKVKSVRKMDQSKGFAPQQNDGPTEVPDAQVVKLGKGKKAMVRNGAW